jgi:hypothetical protein
MIPNEYLIMFLVALVTIILTSLVINARKIRKEKKRREQFNPLVMDDNGIPRYFTWHSRDPVHLINEDQQDQQLMEFFVPLCDALRNDSGMEPQFNLPDNIKGEIVYELAPDYRSKWRLLGGYGGDPGDQVLVLIRKRRKSG